MNSRNYTIHVLICCHVTTYYTKLNIEQLHVSQLRPECPIPDTSAVDADKARLYGLGILPDIKVRSMGANEFEVLSGLVTWRTAQYLRIDSINAMILDVDDDLAREMIAEDFSPPLKKKPPIQEAQAIKDLSIAESTSPTRVGHRLKKDRHTVSNLMRILKLPKNVQAHIESGCLPLGKAKMLLTLSSDLQYDLANKAINEHWSTRKMEAEIRHLKKGGSATIVKQSQPKTTVQPLKTLEQDPEIKREQDRLSDCVGSPIHIDHDAQTGQGKVVISYSNLDVFTGIAERLQTAPTPQSNDYEWDD